MGIDVIGNRQARTALFVALLGLAVPPGVRGQEPFDSLPPHDPLLVKPKVVKLFSKRLPEVWREALARPDADTKCRAAADIARAHERGMTGLGELVGPLVGELDRAGAHAAVRMAVARTLVTLDARGAAPSLARAAATGDLDLREIIEPALARWQYEPVRSEWRSRLKAPPYRRGAILAVRGLAAAGDAVDVPRLRELALDPAVPPPVRLEAARAAGTLRPAGFEPDARSLADGLVDRLVAVNLIAGHGGPEAVSLLQEFARDREPAVAVVAVGRLLAIDPATARPVLGAALASAGGEVRGLAVDVLHRLPTADHVRQLGDLLADPDPAVRIRARRALRELAGGELRPVVIRESMRLLNGADWRGQEQSAILLAQLNHQAAGGRLLELLPSGRPEAGIAAAWSLRVLSNPETYPGVLEFLKARDASYRAAREIIGTPSYPAAAIDRQLSQLVQLMGASRYRPADALVRTIVPRGPYGDATRTAAAYAVGKINEGTPVPEMARIMAGRLSAIGPFDAESLELRTACAIALGRIRAESELETLRRFYPSRQPSLDDVNNACGWAIEQITGEKVPPPGVVEQEQQGWFFTPIGS